MPPIDPVAAVVAIGTVAAAVVAFLQLRSIRRSSELQAASTIWASIDNDPYRRHRRTIHRAILTPGEGPPVHSIPAALWDAIETTATALDRVGSLVDNGLIPGHYVYDRYSEVVIEMWDKTKPYLNHRRGQKGSIAWRYFGPADAELLRQIPQNQTLRTRLDSIAVRLRLRPPHDLYSRTLAYRLHHLEKLRPRSYPPDASDQAQTTEQSLDC